MQTRKQTMAGSSLQEHNAQELQAFTILMGGVPQANKDLVKNQQQSLKVVKKSQYKAITANMVASWFWHSFSYFKDALSADSVGVEYISPSTSRRGIFDTSNSLLGGGVITMFELVHDQKKVLKKIMRKHWETNKYTVENLTLVAPESYQIPCFGARRSLNSAIGLTNNREGVEIEKMIQEINAGKKKVTRKIVKRLFDAKFKALPYITRVFIGSKMKWAYIYVEIECQVECNRGQGINNLYESFTAEQKKFWGTRNYSAGALGLEFHIEFTSFESCKSVQMLVMENITGKFERCESYQYPDRSKNLRKTGPYNRARLIEDSLKEMDVDTSSFTTAKIKQFPEDKAALEASQASKKRNSKWLGKL